MENKETTPKPQREKIYLGVIIALVVLSGFLTWKVFDSQTNIQQVTVQRDEVTDEKTQLENELNEMLEKYNELDTDNEKLTAEMLDQKEQIEDLLDQVKKGKATASQLRKFKKETVTLRTIMKGYVVTIDSLNTLNLELKSENSTIKTNLRSSQEANEALLTEKEKLSRIVDKAAALKAFNIEFGGVRLRSSGKQVETTRANKVELFKTCFEIAKNETTVPGEKTLLLRIFDNNGMLVKELQDVVFETFDKEKLSVSSKRDITYNNESMSVCIYTNLDRELPEGKYLVDIYESGQKMGSAETILK